MRSRYLKIAIVLLVVAGLFTAAYFLHNVDTGVRYVDTAGKIIFLSDRSNPGHPHVWTINDDGTDALELTHGNETDADPSFSADGSQIAYVSDREGEQEVYVMDGDGKHQHRVTIGSDSKASPQFSPDGKSLAYITRGTLTLIDLDTNDTKPILPSPDSATSSNTAALIDVASAPVVRYAWSPDASTPAIAAVQDSELGDLESLTLLPTVDAAPKVVAAANDVSFDWSPDGSVLATALLGVKGLTNNQKFSGIVSFGRDGTPANRQPLAVFASDTVGPQNPSYSPDSTQIAFELVKRLDIGVHQVLGFYSAPIGGGQQARPIIVGPMRGGQWAPDGIHLMVLLPNRQQPSQTDIWVGSASQGAAPVDLTNGQWNATNAKWSPAVKKQ